MKFKLFGLIAIAVMASTVQGVQAQGVGGPTLTDDVAPQILLQNDALIELNVGDAYVEYGAIASDDVDGVIVNITQDVITDSSAVNTAVAGTYYVTYNVTDDAGNDAVQQVRTVTVTEIPDTTKPVIELNGDKITTVIVDGTYVELGATVTDNVDTDLVLVINSKEVKTKKVGEYIVTYDATDAAGNKATQVTRTVSVQEAPVAIVDKTAPSIALNGPTTVTITQGEVYEDAGATALDSIDGTLTSKITTTGIVNTAVVGTYHITYNVTDAAGNKAMPRQRTVTVQPKVVVDPVNPPEQEVVQESTVSQEQEVETAQNITTTVQGDYTFVTTMPNVVRKGEVASIEIAVTNNAGPQDIIIYTFLSNLPEGTPTDDEGIFTTDKFFEGEQIAIGQTKTYTFPWLNDEEAGNYKLFGEIKSVDWSQTLQKNQIGQVQVSSQDPQALGETLHRFYSSAYRGHFYTTSEVEKQNLIDNDPNWVYEGVGNKTVSTDNLSPSNIQDLGVKPVYRFWNDTYKHHFYTVSEAEKQATIDDPNWEYEAIAYYTYTDRQMDTIEVFRFYSPQYKGHFYTTSSDERDAIIANDQNWVYEGVAWYAQR